MKTHPPTLTFPRSVDYYRQQKAKKWLRWIKSWGLQKLIDKAAK